MTLFDDIRSKPIPAPSHRVVIWAASACAVMSGAAIAPTIPAIETAFSGAAGGSAWGRVALVVPAVLIMLAGPWIGKQTGRTDQRLGFIIALCAMAVFGVLGGLANGFGWLIATRIGLGVATAATLCFATAAITTLFQGPARGLVISRQAAVNTFGYIAKAIGPQDVLATLLNNLKVQERQMRVCTTVAIAIVAESCAPFTVLPGKPHACA